MKENTAKMPITDNNIEQMSSQKYLSEVWDIKSLHFQAGAQSDSDLGVVYSMYLLIFNKHHTKYNIVQPPPAPP